MRAGLQQLLAQAEAAGQIGGAGGGRAPPQASPQLAASHDSADVAGAAATATAAGNGAAAARIRASKGPTTACGTSAFLRRGNNAVRTRVQAHLLRIQEPVVQPTK
jgi:hypothetical protein